MSFGLAGDNGQVDAQPAKFPLPAQGAASRLMLATPLQLACSLWRGLSGGKHASAALCSPNETPVGNGARGAVKMCLSLLCCAPVRHIHHRSAPWEIERMVRAPKLAICRRLEINDRPETLVGARLIPLPAPAPAR
ncbi:hypothetical protein EYF80_014311 [Liparis tanakae]|uniref:Uncharacterized protein n=1 Tax=Liparis tanakae TaxID=230148 RepID=A0A4Z2IBT3_9TELE|nr:hypothetical protein EYF80_014311 [Liparis tanakae]